VQQFIAGIIVALLVVLPVIVLLLCKRGDTGKQQQGGNEHVEQLEELSKLTGELAHEIKNPLSTIKINLKLASEELKGPQSIQSTEQSGQRIERALRKIAVIQKETDRLGQILEGFLRYIDRTELQLASVDINEIISDMADFYTSQAQSHSITIRQGLYEKPLICKVDAGMLKQVLLNLFINAQQAMSDGGELLIRTSRQKDQAIIQVSDTGSGIEPDKLSHIFDVYYSSRPHGSGLGLPTAKKIVEAHKGTITVDSEAGKGTLFTIQLPLQDEIT